MTTDGSIDRPEARGRELQQVSVGIAEIDAVATARPVGAAFDGDATLAEPAFPRRQLVGGDRKRQVQRSVAIVRRDRAAGQVHGLERGAAAKQQQHALAADIVGAKARIAGQGRELEHPLVETSRPLEVIDVEAGLEHTAELRHVSHHILRTERASSDIRLGSQGGSQTMLTLTSPTPATLATAFSTMEGSSCAEGQLGVVKVMSTVTARSSAMSIL